MEITVYSHHKQLKRGYNGRRRYLRPVKEISEVADDPHLKEREMINEIDHPDYGPISVPGIPIRFSGSDLPDIEPSPSKGRDNKKVFCERLGYTEEEFEELKDRDVI